MSYPTSGRCRVTLRESSHIPPTLPSLASPNVPSEPLCRQSWDELPQWFSAMLIYTQSARKNKQKQVKKKKKRKKRTVQQTKQKRLKQNKNYFNKNQPSHFVSMARKTPRPASQNTNSHPHCTNTIDAKRILSISISTEIKCRLRPPPPHTHPPSPHATTWTPPPPHSLSY